MAEGGGDLIVVVFIPFEVITCVDSETIGSAAIDFEATPRRNNNTIKAAIKLFFKRVDTSY